MFEGNRLSTKQRIFISVAGAGTLLLILIVTAVLLPTRSAESAVSKESGQNVLPAENYSLNDIMDIDSSASKDDKQKKYWMYFEKQLESQLTGEFESIKSADITINFSEEDGELTAVEQEASVWVLLELKGEFTADHAASVAKAVSKSLGNRSEENIVIMDTDGNILFSGEDT